METQQELDYKRVAEAISFFKENFKSQPKLEDVAGHVNLSPFHFQRMFQQWAGVTPKQFLQYLSVEHAKNIIATTGASLFDTAYETGLSGTGRLHDLFIKVEGMTPGEWKNGGALLNINYSFADTPFGKVIVASTDKGICHMAFADEGEEGTDFQIRIWQTLLEVPVGGLTTYSAVAQKAGYNGASRAVGTAIGNNPVAFLIPCHRVIKSTGEIGQYHWGTIRKNAIIGWEAALKNHA